MSWLQTTNPIFGRPLVDALLGALSVVPGAALLATPHVHLFTAGPTPITSASLPADFTEATFVGYAAQALNLPLVGPINADDDHRGVHNEENFLGGAIVAPGETVLGYWIDNAAAAGTIMYMAETFETPVQFANPGDFLSLDVDFTQRLSDAINNP